jgi:4-amino-4-deoxy-L-arabinose transferase-like glycosyltransferase
LFFSLASSKLGTYLLPIFPALALLTGHAFTALFDARAGRRGFLLAWGALTALFLVGALVMIVRPIEALRTEAGIDLGGFTRMTAAGGVFLALGLALTIRRRYRAAFATLPAMMALGLIAMLVTLAPSVNEYRSAREIARRCDERLPPGDRMVFFQRWMDSALFYTDRELYVVKNPHLVRKYFGSPDRVYCLTYDRYLPRLPDWEEFAHIVDRTGPILLLSNRPDP